MQRITTKMVLELSSLPQESRLGEMDQLIDEERRMGLFEFIGGFDKLDRSDLTVTGEETVTS